MENNDLILKKVFTKNMLYSLIKDGCNEELSCCIKKYSNDPIGKDYRTLIKEIYSYMDDKYRNEYFYKNTILNKLLLGRHSLNTTTALTELPIERSKADFAMINGKGVVYEIKTELDNIDRLNNQIEDYYKAFKLVYVVTCEEHYDRIVNLINENVGILLLTNRNSLKTVREAKEYSSKLSYNTIFKILRKAEFETIIESKGIKLPAVSQFQYYNECKNIITELNILDLQKEMLKMLKKRELIEIDEFKSIVPYELKFLVYFSSFNKKEYHILNKVLKFKFEG